MQTDESLSFYRSEPNQGTGTGANALWAGAQLAIFVAYVSIE
jgi:hypothetical protein